MFASPRTGWFQLGTAVLAVIVRHSGRVWALSDLVRDPAPEHRGEGAALRRLVFAAAAAQHVTVPAWAGSRALAERYVDELGPDARLCRGLRGWKVTRAPR